MINNDVIRSIRYILNIRDNDLVKIFELADFQVPLLDVQDFLRNDEDPNYLECNDEVMAHFLDGLVYYKRGKDDRRPPVPLELPMSNNIVLKKLRVAFELREDDILGILEEAGFRVGRAELSALFRRKGHQNYRECGDQLLRNFLKGLALHFRA
jgi:uncharacterized protein YehS (DUF1456 family)